MVFCGQCGSQIASGSPLCPNCGAESDIPVEVTRPGTDATLHVDDPTVESRSLGSSLRGPYPMHTTPSAYSTQQNVPFTPGEQSKLVLHSDGAYNYDAQVASDATSAMRPSPYGAYPSSPNPAPYSNAPSSPFNTVAEQANYPNASYTPTQTPPNYQSNPGPAYGNYSAYPQQYPQMQAAQPMQPVRQRRGRVPVLLAVLLLLVLVLGGLVAYALHYARVVGTTATTGGGTSVTTNVLTPSEHARAVVQQYYSDINNKNYHEAYYLWKRDGRGQTYASFVSGYSHTVRDDLTINYLVSNASSGTVKVEITIVATEDNGSGTVQHTYGGYYIVGQVNGTWKILSGYLSQLR